MKDICCITEYYAVFVSLLQNLFCYRGFSSIKIGSKCGKSVIVPYSQRKYYWCTQNAKKLCYYQIVYFCTIVPHILCSYCSSNFQRQLKLLLLISFAYFLYLFDTLVRGFFSVSSLNSYRSSNYCNSNCCRSFLQLKGMTISFSLLFAITLKSEKSDNNSWKSEIFRDRNQEKK